MERFPCLSDELLSAYLDGELTPTEWAVARRHLDSCGRCTTQLATFGRLDTVLAAPPAIDCASALPLLSARHDRELTLPEVLVAEAHAVRCAACRAQVAVWSAVDEKIAALPAAQPSTRVA